MTELYAPYWSTCDGQTHLVATPPLVDAKAVVDYAMRALARNDWRQARTARHGEWYPDWGLRVLFFLSSPDLRARAAWTGDYNLYRDDFPDAWRWWFKQPASSLKSLVDNGGRYSLSVTAGATDCKVRILAQMGARTIAFDCVRVWAPYQQTFDYWRIAAIQPA